MPFIKKNKSIQKVDFKRKERQRIYQSERWKQLRIAKLMQSPLCEICLAKGITKPAVDVHHVDSFMNYSGTRQLQAAYNFDNLQSLCKECHSEVHKNRRSIFPEPSLEENGGST